MAEGVAITGFTPVSIPMKSEKSAGMTPLRACRPLGETGEGHSRNRPRLSNRGAKGIDRRGAKGLGGIDVKSFNLAPKWGA
jgi:hypothetical protein